MASDHYLRPIISQPGIQRDGTPFDSEFYIDGQWCRFYKNRPRKIGGYKLIDPGDTTIIRTMTSVPKANSIDLYLGRHNSVKYFNTTVDGFISTEVDRTPVDFIDDPNNVWTLQRFNGTYGGGDLTSFIIGVAPPNGSDYSNSVSAKIYYGSTDNNTPLQPLVSAGTIVGEILVSGGIIGVGQFLFAYGNNGTVLWTEGNDISKWDIANVATIAGTKIVAAQSTRGGGVPGVLFWSLNSLLRGTYSGTGGPTTSSPYAFSFDTIQDNITILSPNSVVYYNQTCFWPGIDQFYFYNGVVQSLKNTMNSDFFFDNLNYQYQEKVWGMIVPRYKEIWWVFPNRNAPNSTECNWAVVFNVQDNIWYDTPITRSAGTPPTILPYPIMADSSPRSNLSVPVQPGQLPEQVYGVWFHEYLFDEYFYNQINAIRSYFQTAFMTSFEASPGEDKQMRSLRVEPDFKQVEDMTLVVSNQSFPSSTPTLSDTYTFSPITGKIDMRQMGRLVSYIFESNTVGGFYQCGKPLLSAQFGDTRP